MKQLLFLLLFPCLALAQYPGNAGQKITLGEQTSADGLVYRGLAADTTRKPSVDTMAYILLDTNTNIIWQYKKATNNAWTRVGGSISSGVTGILPVANGGTGQNTLAANKVMVGNGTSGVLTPTDLHWNNTYSRLGVGTISPVDKLDVSGGFKISKATFVAPTSGSGLEWSFRTDNIGYLSAYDRDNALYRSMSIGVANFNVDTDADGDPNFTVRQTSGEAWIGYTTDQGAYRFQVKDSVYVGGNVSASAYTTRSDYNLKDEIQNISYGLNEVMQMQPVKYTYKSNGSTQLGFIAQDLGVITPEVVSFEDKMSVYYNSLIPILTKAIQEQNVLIKALEQRILILENK